MCVSVNLALKPRRDDVVYAPEKQVWWVFRSGLAAQEVDRRCENGEFADGVWYAVGPSPLRLKVCCPINQPARKTDPGRVLSEILSLRGLVVGDNDQVAENL